MKSAFLLLVVALSFGLGGCTTMSGPTPAELKAATFSPVPANIEALIKAQYAVILKDPYSAVFEMGKPFKAYMQGANNTKMFGYVIPMGVNAKNSFGGYTGEQLEYWGWANGQLYNLDNAMKFGGVVPLD